MVEDAEDSAAGPSQRTYLAESSAETSVERLTTLRKKARSQSIVETKGLEQEKFKSRKHVLENLQKSGIRFTPHLTVVLYCSLGSH